MTTTISVSIVGPYGENKTLWTIIADNKAPRKACISHNDEIIAYWDRNIHESFDVAVERMIEEIKSAISVEVLGHP